MDLGQSQACSLISVQDGNTCGVRVQIVTSGPCMCRYAELIYNGFWFSPEREALQALIDHTQRFVSGTVRLKLYKVCSWFCLENRVPPQVEVNKACRNQTLAIGTVGLSNTPGSIALAGAHSPASPQSVLRSQCMLTCLVNAMGLSWLLNS